MHGDLFINNLWSSAKLGKRQTGNDAVSAFEQICLINFCPSMFDVLCQKSVIAWDSRCGRDVKHLLQAWARNIGISLYDWKYVGSFKGGKDCLPSNKTFVTYSLYVVSIC